MRVSNRTCFACVWLSLAVCCLPNAIFAQTRSQPDEARLTYFEKHVRPALTQYCFECHATHTEANGGLVLDSKAGWEIGGDSGTAIVPGNLEQSRFVQAIRYENPKLLMPPDKKLPLEVIRVLETWIEDGAADPRTTSNGPIKKSGTATSDAAVTHWAYQPRTSPQPAVAVDARASAVIDYFVNKKLEVAEIRAAPPAEPRDQVRRLYYDLTGLPPTPRDMREILAAEDFEVAYRQKVEDLLSSPHFGESVARRWMDVARYAESVTLRGLVFKEAWRYRDYLVTSFNQDRPFDQMIREQVAGDLLQSDDRAERAMQLVATSFLALGDTNFEKQDKQQLEMDYIDEQLDVIGQAFLGQTLGCARCHDHKFDPIPTKDYYALAGIFKTAVALRHANVSNWIDMPLPSTPEEKKRFDALEADLKEVTKSLAAKKKQAATLAKSNASSKPNANSKPESGSGLEASKAANTNATTASNSEDEQTANTIAEDIKGLEARQKKLQEDLDQQPKYLTVSEEGSPKDIPIHIRGDVHNLGEVVPRGFLTAFEVQPRYEIPDKMSGRLEFAQWLSSASNPLTARVYANRIWSWLLGQGIVDSVNNFGTTGTHPSHPELLDWLANELIQNHWSTKHLVRTIVLSDVYRRKVVSVPNDAADVDPDNRLYWGGSSRRLSAEELRDSMLQASGELETWLGGTIMKPATKSDGNYAHATHRRSLYHPLFRNSLPELFDAFDFPNPGISVGQRARSTVSTQALVLLNHPWVHARAKALAARLQRENEYTDPVVLIGAAYQLCLQRSPNIEELKTCMEFFEPRQETLLPRQLEQFVHTLLASIDFRYLE
jgi:hypothetical protein